MSTIVIYGLIAIVVLYIFSKIPGVGVVAEMILKSMFDLCKFIFSNASFWGIYIVKNLSRAHKGFFFHLTHTKKQCDPLLDIRTSAEERNKD